MTQHQDGFADKTRHSKQEQVDEFEKFKSDATDNLLISNPEGGQNEIKLFHLDHFGL